jgi:DNA polymerase-3 subunit beta
MNPEEFPDIPKIEDVEFFSIPSLEFRKMVERSLVIGTGDDKRAHITGAYLERRDEDGLPFVRMVSTDGSRLSTVDFKPDAEARLPDFEGILVPKKGLAEVSKFLETEGSVQVGIKENHLIVRKATETIVIRLLEGDFPKYADIIDKGENRQILLQRGHFLMMLKRMSILSSENYRGVIFNFSEGVLTVSSTNPDIGESREEMAVDYTGEPIEVAFNAKFFIDAVGAVDEENVVLHILDDEKPCFVEAEKDKSFLNVIMPMRI